MIGKIKNLIIKVITNKKLMKELAFYGVIGVTCAIIDSTTYILLSKSSVDMYIANLIGMNLGIVLSFFLNAFLNFKKTDKLVNRFIKFVSVGYVGVCISMLIMFIGVDVMKFNDTLIKIASVFIVAAIQFVLNKLFAFKNKKEDE